MTLDAVERDGLRHGLLLDLLRHTEDGSVHEGGEQGATDWAEPVDPVTRPLIVPQRRCQRPRRVHAAAGVGPDRGRQHRHRQPELDRHRVRILLVPRVPDGAHHQYQHAGRDTLDDQTLDRGEITVKISHAKHIRLVGRAGGQVFLWRYHLRRKEADR